MLEGKFYKRFDLIDALKAQGYNVLNNDVAWAHELKIINPYRLNKAMFLYSEDDYYWLEMLGELKNRGLEKSVITKILETGTLNLVTELVQKIQMEKEL